MRTSYVLLGVLFCTGLLSGQRISERKLLRQIQKTPQLSDAFVGISIQKLNSDKTVTHLNEKRYMTPASNIKLITFLGAIQTFKHIPALEYALENEHTTHFRPTGYPLLFHPFYPDSILNHFFQDKTTWVYHPPNTKPTLLGSGWSWDDYGYYYAAPRSVFPIYGNSVRAVLRDSGLDLTPLFTANVDSTITNFERSRFENKFSYNPQNWKRNDTLYRPFIPNDTLFINLLGKATNAQFSLSKQQDSLLWKPLYTDQEERLYKGLLQDSDNGIAEALLLMIANQQLGIFKTEKAIEGLQRQWSSWLPDPLEWVDGSGVSRYNMVTPRTLVAVLQKIHQELPWETIQTLFPQSGAFGTLKAYKGLDGVYAKTGTLRHNHNLAGYWVSPKGTKYVFSIMVNHHTASTLEIRQGITALLLYFQKTLK